MKKVGLRKAWKWFNILFLVYMLTGFFTWYFQERLIFRPVKTDPGQPYTFDIPFREINIPVSKEKNLSVVQFKVPDSLRKGIVLYFHGNRGNILRYAPQAPAFTRQGYEVWMMDYPGFGKSTGERNERILYEDALTLYKMANAAVPVEKIILYGKSLGTGIAAQLATVRSCKRLILETPYYDMPAVFRRYLPVYPLNWMLRYEFPTGSRMAFIHAPVSIFHGTRDGVIAYRNAQRLAREFKPGDELITIAGGSHNNLFSFPEAREKLDSLLRLP